MLNVIKAAAYIGAFFGSIACAFFCAWLTAAIEFGAITVNEFADPSLIDAQTFMALISATLGLCFVLIACGVLALLNRRCQPLGY